MGTIETLASRTLRHFSFSDLDLWIDLETRGNLERRLQHWCDTSLLNEETRRSKEPFWVFPRKLRGLEWAPRDTLLFWWSFVDVDVDLEGWHACLPLYGIIDRLLRDESTLPARQEYVWQSDPPLNTQPFQSAFRFDELCTFRLCRAMRLWRLVRAAGVSMELEWILQPRDEQGETDALHDIHQKWAMNCKSLRVEVTKLAWHKNVEFLSYNIMACLVTPWPCLLEHAE